MIPLTLFLTDSLELLKGEKWREDYDYESKFVPKSTFYLALLEKYHFFEPIVLTNIQVAFERINHVINCLHLIETIETEISYEECESNISSFLKRIMSVSFTEKQIIICNEIRRVYSLFSLLYKCGSTNLCIDSVLNNMCLEKYNILDFLYNCNVNIVKSVSFYEDVIECLEKNLEYNQLICLKPLKNSSRMDEKVVYCQFVAINCFVEILLDTRDTKSFEEGIRYKVCKLKKAIADIKTELSFIETIEYLYTMFFLRFEYIDTNNYATTWNESDSDPSGNAVFEIKSQQSIHSDKNGFICTFTSLGFALNILKSVVDSYNSTHEYTERFLRITNAISEALDRYEMIHMQFYRGKYCRIAKKLKQLISSFDESILIHGASSSEDEDGRSKTALCEGRRPHFAKNQKRKQNSAANSTTKTGIVRSDSVISTTHCDNQCAMWKMFSSKTDLIAICLSKGNLQKAKITIEVIY